MSAENARATAETARAFAEQSRVSAEESRVSAENQRAEAFAGYETRIDAATPDDSAVGGRPWTSKRIVDALCPPFEASGGVVTCRPVEGYPLGVTASWEPMQEGEGDPSPDNIRPITERDSVSVTLSGEAGGGTTNALTFPRAICGGEVDAVTGEGVETWGKLTLNGTERWIVYGTNQFSLTILNSTFPAITNSDERICSHFISVQGTAWSALTDGYFATNQTYLRFCKDDMTVDEWKAYLAEQYAAGTPVTVAYKLAEPVPFAAAGGGTLPGLSGVNTIYTNGDGVTVTGRTDPIWLTQSLMDRIAALEGAAIRD